MAGAALSLDDGALAREAAAQGLVATRSGIMRYGRPSQVLGRERARQDLQTVGYVESGGLRTW